MGIGYNQEPEDNSFEGELSPETHIWEGYTILKWLGQGENFNAVESFIVKINSEDQFSLRQISDDLASSLILCGELSQAESFELVSKIHAKGLIKVSQIMRGYDYFNTVMGECIKRKYRESFQS